MMPALGPLAPLLPLLVLSPSSVALPPLAINGPARGSLTSLLPLLLLLMVQHRQPHIQLMHFQGAVPLPLVHALQLCHCLYHILLPCTPHVRSDCMVCTRAGCLVSRPSELTPQRLGCHFTGRQGSLQGLHVSIVSRCLLQQHSHPLRCCGSGVLCSPHLLLCLLHLSCMPPCLSLQRLHALFSLVQLPHTPLHLCLQRLQLLVCCRGRSLCCLQFVLALHGCLLQRLHFCLSLMLCLALYIQGLQSDLLAPALLKRILQRLHVRGTLLVHLALRAFPGLLVHSCCAQGSKLGLALGDQLLLYLRACLQRVTQLHVNLRQALPELRAGPFLVGQVLQGLPQRFLQPLLPLPAVTTLLFQRCFLCSCFPLCSLLCLEC
mmetsp:Transcript_26999/g.69595  ORF Transcript_26999/g.69595 Transcript_26999/m.69595 type:complete len:377 (-) Transcript_26999:1428-2558(-)